MTTDAPDRATFPSAATSPIRAVLLDADGVLQLIGTPWDEALSAGGGTEFKDALLNGEVDALCGRETLHALLTRLVVRLGLSASAEELMDLWHQATPDEEARSVVGELRAAGYVTVLATNQQPERREWMRDVLHYDGLCDLDAYSCVLGLAKPDPDYFRRVLEMLAMPAHEVLFVDDNPENITAARELGMATVLHPADAGGTVLRGEILDVLCAGS